MHQQLICSAKARGCHWVSVVLVSLLVALLAGGVPPVRAPAAPGPAEMIVQAGTMDAAAALVENVGGSITHELGIIDAVGAQLTPAQRDSLEKLDEVEIYQNGAVQVAGKPGPDTFYPTLVRAVQLHEDGITGKGVSVAVIDTGNWSHVALNKDDDGKWRVLVQYDAIIDQVVAFGTNAVTNDESGHGVHVTSVILSSRMTRDKLYNGIAPGACLVSIRSFSADGAGSYLDVIRGIDWAVANKGTYNIRVLNLSFSAPPQSYYWDDPLNQAVMRAWQAGIVVVAAAGNAGPNAMTIGVPGNVPYVITVGAMSDRHTPADPADDFLASFSADS